MVGLPDGEKTLWICVTVYTQHWCVMDGRTDRDILPRHSSRYADALRGKNQCRNLLICPMLCMDKIYIYLCVCVSVTLSVNSPTGQTVILKMTLSEPQCSCVVATFRGINSKDEQGNDNIIACGDYDSSTATENILNIRRPYMTRRSSNCRSSSSSSVIV